MTAKLLLAACIAIPLAADAADACADSVAVIKAQSEVVNKLQDRLKALNERIKKLEAQKSAQAPPAGR